MGDEEIKYHEHDMVRVEKPAIKQAKALCLFVLAIAFGGAWFYLQSPPDTRALIDASDFWPCVITASIVAIVAIRAILS